PVPAMAGDEVLHLERDAGGEPDGGEIEVHGGLPDGVWVDVRDDDDRVVSAVGRESPVEVLRVHEHGVVLARVEADVAQLAEGRVRVADAVQEAGGRGGGPPLLP